MKARSSLPRVAARARCWQGEGTWKEGFDNEKFVKEGRKALGTGRTEEEGTEKQEKYREE